MGSLQTINHPRVRAEGGYTSSWGCPLQAHPSLQAVCACGRQGMRAGTAPLQLRSCPRAHTCATTRENVSHARSMQGATRTAWWVVGAGMEGKPLALSKDMSGLSRLRRRRAHLKGSAVRALDL